MKNKWTPIAERFPDKSGSYLVSLKSGSVMQTHFYIDKMDGTKKFANRYVNKCVVAWMPLPKPYNCETVQRRKVVWNEID